jgi:LacI family transcriptional regulator
MVGARKPTINDVAAAAGVSRATASRALSNYGRIAEETVDRVRQAAEELGYRPNQVAQAMRAGKTKTIGLVIIADFTNAFFDRVTKSIVDSAKSAGYQVLISNTDEDIEVERQAVENLLEKQVDGVILTPSTVAVHDHLTAKSMGGKPLVLIDRRLETLKTTSVTTDDFTGAEQAVRHASSLGHTRFGFLIAVPGVKGFVRERPAMMISPIEERVDGFANGAVECGIKTKNAHWFFSEDHPVASQSAAAALLDLPKPPTVILTSNNDMLLAVLKVAGNRRLRIGQDISVITFDDSEWAQAMVPGITVVSRPVEEVGQIAVEKLVTQIDEKLALAEKIVLPTELIARDSVANLKLRPELDPEYQGTRDTD